MPAPLRRGPYLFCPKSGRFIGCRPGFEGFRWTFPIVGLCALVWYLVRVLPKPDRAGYPCQRVAMPVAWGFLASLAGWIVAALAVRKARRLFAKGRLFFGMFFIGGAVAGGLVGLIHSAERAEAYVPLDPPNTPIGVARGLFPGRVVWAHDPAATKWDGTNGTWWADACNDQAAIDAMVSASIRVLTATLTDAGAWDALFKAHNAANGSPGVGYRTNETVAIKINMNNMSTTNDVKSDNRLDASPQLVLSVVRQLVEQAGVPAAKIIVYDAQRLVGDHIAAKVYGAFPGVRFVQVAVVSNTFGRERVTWVNNSIAYSDPGVTNVAARRLPRQVLDAKYLINMACLKKHGDGAETPGGNGNTALTLCAKNHFGTIGSPFSMHSFLWPSRGMEAYNPLVDICGSGHLGGKTILYLIDGLYGAYKHNSVPIRYPGAPFNNHWPSMLLASQDPVAIDSVGMDFLNSFCPKAMWSCADNYLHEMALADNPPSGTGYQPDGARLSSLGAHEHWNDATNRQYSRNLGTGLGIELVAIPQGSHMTALQTWRLSHLGTTEDIGPAADGADFEGDGVPNLLEYALGLDPRRRDVTGVPQPSLSDGRLGFDLVEPSGVQGITYGAEISEDLVHWTPLADEGAGTTHRFWTSMSSADGLFMRQSVSVP